MSESPLELRSWWIVALGYVAAPVVALTALWLYAILPSLFFSRTNGFEVSKAMELWALMLMIGGWVCLTVELLVVTPVLIGFSRYRWRWLNGWSAAVIGFAMGAIPWLIFGAWPPPEPGQSYIVGDVPLILDGDRTLAGWQSVFGDAAKMGAIGLIAAVTFRLIGFRQKRSWENASQ